MAGVSEGELAVMAQFFKALGDVTRLKILFLLLDGEKCQCDLISYIGLSQPAISRQLQILVNSGLLNLKRNGNKRIYSLTDNARIILLDKTPLKLSKRV